MEVLVKDCDLLRHHRRHLLYVFLFNSSVGGFSQPQLLFDQLSLFLVTLFFSLCIQLIIYHSDFYVLKLQRLPQLRYGELSLSGVLLILVKLLEVILLVRFCPLLLNNSDSIKVVIFYMSRHNKCKSKKLVHCWHHVFNKQYRTSIVVHIKVVRRNLLSLFKSSILLRYNAWIWHKGTTKGSSHNSYLDFLVLQIRVHISCGYLVID